MTGFSYNGIHSSAFGLYYIPSADDLWFADPEYDVYDQSMSWKHGGYYYDSKVKVRKFTIKCYFEEIDTATRQRIKQWVRYNSSGMLVFDDMPFVYWIVRPAKIPQGSWYIDNNESHSGTVTLTFNAYEPFGYLTRKSNGSGDHGDGAEDYCHLINTDDMPPIPSTSSTAFDVYNPGTEACGLTLEISGSTSNPIRFYNEKNGTFCILNGLPPNNTHLMLDGETGMVSMFEPGDPVRMNGFAYHDIGMVSLSPNIGYSDVAFTYGGVNGTIHTLIPTNTAVSDDMVGAKIYISGVSSTVFTVTGVNIGTNRIYCSKSGSGNPPSSGTFDMIQTNHILIQENRNNAWATPSTLSLTTLGIDYKPRIL